MDMFEKTKCNFRKTTSLHNKWHGGFSWEKISKDGAHTFFVQKISQVNWGKVWIGHAIRLVYAKGFRSVDWLHASNPDQSFPLLVSRLPLACSSYDIPSGWDEKRAEQGGSKFQMASLLDKVETLVHLKERRGHKLINSFNQTSSPCLNLLWKIQINENEIKFHHSTSLTGSVNERVYQKIGNIKETYSFKFACLVGRVSKKQEK